MSSNNHLKDLYLNTLRDTLTGEIFNDNKAGHGFWCNLFHRIFPSLEISKRVTNSSEYSLGKHWPSKALTMVGKKRLDNIRFALETCIAEDVKGDFVECGVWRGGASIFAAGVIKAYSPILNRYVFCFDSFEGLPPASTSIDLADKHSASFSEQLLSVSRQDVLTNFARFDLMDLNVHLIEGWFENTLPKYMYFSVDSPIAVLRADGDWYSSTKCILENLYQHVSPKGFIIIDDYGMVEACKIAVDEFRSVNNITTPLVDIDGSGVYWRKE